MRHHRILSAKKERVKASNPSIQGYGLRQNPKKSLKASNSEEIHPKRRRHKLGTLLQGSGSTGHAKVHPVRGNESLSNHRRIRPEKFELGRNPPANILADVEPIPIPEESNRDQQQPLAPSPVSESEQDVEELALGLMPLSRGLRYPVNEFMETIRWPTPSIKKRIHGTRRSNV